MKLGVAQSALIRNVLNEKRPIIPTGNNGIVLHKNMYFQRVHLDPERTGFYLRVSAIGRECERDFPGYFISDLQPVG